jgi:hypothetical protein
MKQVKTLATASAEAPKISVKYLDQTNSKIRELSPDKKTAIQSSHGVRVAGLYLRMRVALVLCSITWIKEL